MAGALWSGSGVLKELETLKSELAMARLAIEGWARVHLEDCALIDELRARAEAETRKRKSAEKEVLEWGSRAAPGPIPVPTMRESPGPLPDWVREYLGRSDE